MQNWHWTEIDWYIFPNLWVDMHRIAVQDTAESLPHILVLLNLWLVLKKQKQLMYNLCAQLEATIIHHRVTMGCVSSAAQWEELQQLSEVQFFTANELPPTGPHQRGSFLWATSSESGKFVCLFPSTPPFFPKESGAANSKQQTQTWIQRPALLLGERSPVKLFKEFPNRQGWH